MNKKIAILGSTGHIAKNIILYLSQKKNVDLFLFSKNKKEVLKFLNKISVNKKKVNVNSYKNFEKNHYDSIINCIGNVNVRTNKHSSFLKINEYYDNKVLRYLKNNKDCLYIYLSSGAIYGGDFSIPINDKSLSVLNINKVDSTYAIYKLYSEAKHRSLSELNIVDLRIFGFFSRFIDIRSNYFLSQVISALRIKKNFLTNEIDIKRDYIHPFDLSEIIMCCIKKRFINDVFDVFSKKPVKKFTILKFLEKEYDLKYEIKKKELSEEIKINYYSNSKKLLKIGYKSKYTSFEAVKSELKLIFKDSKIKNE